MMQGKYSSSSYCVSDCSQVGVVEGKSVRHGGGSKEAVEAIGDGHAVQDRKLVVGGSEKLLVDGTEINDVRGEGDCGYEVRMSAVFTYCHCHYHLDQARYKNPHRSKVKQST